MASLADGKAVFKEHAETVGLPPDVLERLIDQGVEGFSVFLSNPNGAPSYRPGLFSVSGFCAFAPVWMMRRRGDEGFLCL